MEADGTRYLEAALKTEPKNAEDYCNRGKVYYIWKIIPMTEGTYGGCESEEYRRNASSGNGLPRTG